MAPLFISRGTKSWIQRVVVDGRHRELGLGSFPTIPLGKARSLTVANHRAIADGRDPLAEKRAGSSPSRDAPAMAACVNNTCPWSGNPVQPDSLTTYGSKVVGFSSPGFRDLFDAAIRHFERSATSTTRD